MPHVQHDYFSSFHQGNYCFEALSLPWQSSILKLPNIDNKRKRDGKMMNCLSSPKGYLGTNYRTTSWIARVTEA